MLFLLVMLLYNINKDVFVAIQSSFLLSVCLTGYINLYFCYGFSPLSKLQNALGRSEIECILAMQV